MIPRTDNNTRLATIACWHLVLLGLQTPLSASAAEHDSHELQSKPSSASNTSNAMTSTTGHSATDAAQTTGATTDHQNTAQARADLLFREGLELMHADRCSEAIDRFERSERLDSSAATLMNLAICHEHLNRPATAWRVFVRAVDAATAEGDTDLRTQAAEALSKLGPVLTRLRIITAQHVDRQVIKVNGERVSDYRDPIPVDPGEQVIEVSAPGRKAWRVKVFAKGVGTISVEVPALTPDLELQPRGTDLRPVAIAVGGLGVVGVSIGAIYAVRAASANDSANEHGTCTERYCDAIAHEWRETAWDRARVATWATSLGLIGVATGTLLWVVSPSGKAESRVGVTPWFDAKSNGGGMIVGGRL